MRINLKVVPGASRNTIAGWLGDSLKVRVQAPPEKGKANKAVIKLIAQTLNISPDQLEIVAGGSSAHKIVEIKQLSETEVFRLLAKPE